MANKDADSSLRYLSANTILPTFKNLKSLLKVKQGKYSFFHLSFISIVHYNPQERWHMIILDDLWQI